MTILVLKVKIPSLLNQILQAKERKSNVLSQFWVLSQKKNAIKRIKAPKQKLVCRKSLMVAQ